MCTYQRASKTLSHRYLLSFEVSLALFPSVRSFEAEWKRDEFFIQLLLFQGSLWSLYHSSSLGLGLTFSAQRYIVIFIKVLMNIFPDRFIKLDYKVIGHKFYKPQNCNGWCEEVVENIPGKQFGFNKRYVLKNFGNFLKEIILTADHTITVSSLCIT